MLQSAQGYFYLFSSSFFDCFYIGARDFQVSSVFQAENNCFCFNAGE